ncbi:hypothetical protein ACFQE1_05045 [Halobium palmae]|uniref:Flagella cluster protein n=1 Tax=Halobium palmae TaxID=1776492 RepID=A0ABD5RX14_9EURY
MAPDTPDDSDTVDAAEAADGPVFDPDELDFTKHDEVSELGEDRFVVSADAATPPKNVPDVAPETAPEPEPESSADDADADDPDGGDEPEPVDAQAVSRWLAESMSNNGFDYGFDATLKFDGSVCRHRMVSNDVVTTFETLLLWYARQVGSDTPVEETLGILLAESDIPITYPPRTVRTLLDQHDVSPEDSVADLLASVEDDGGARLSTR